MRDVRVGGADRADGEADDVVVVDDGRYHVQRAGHVDCAQQHLRHRVTRLQPAIQQLPVSESVSEWVSAWICIAH